MTTRTELPEGLVWREDGHVSDLAVSALADGEESILPGEASEHLDQCETCLDRLASAASLALSVQTGIRGLPSPITEVALQPLRFPTAMAALALTIAAAGVLGSLPSPSSWIGTLAGGLHVLGVLARNLLDVVPMALHRLSTSLAMAALTGAAWMAVGGWLIARTGLPPRGKGLQS